ncbi:hypothetical protein [Pseudomonas sp. Irchel 3E13]|uniref:hypothetical protein n=1 Tax=Pseudomonas sp. Irchel 3E13 TaxID=2008975 RepID=UPI000BA42E3D|nr:hypothetical protein [Pseudomonas sp. Irchel 3E13]
MAKFQITVDDNGDTVSISIDNQSELHSSPAGRVVDAMMNGARLLGRIPVPINAAMPGCDCDICKATRELYQTKPTIH